MNDNRQIKKFGIISPGIKLNSFDEGKLDSSENFMFESELNVDKILRDIGNVFNVSDSSLR